MQCLPSYALNGGIYARFGSTKQQGGRSRLLAASEALEWTIGHPPASSLVLRSTSGRGWCARSTQDFWQESDEIKHNTRDTDSKSEKLPFAEAITSKRIQNPMTKTLKISPQCSLPALVKHNMQWQLGSSFAIARATDPNRVRKWNSVEYGIHHRNGYLPKAYYNQLIPTDNNHSLWAPGLFPRPL